jgi:hypothetical protein
VNLFSIISTMTVVPTVGMTALMMMGIMAAVMWAMMPG